MEYPGEQTVKFLIIRLSSIGDIVLTTPVIRCLKKQVDHARIHYLVKEAFLPVLSANPYLDRIHVFRGDLPATIRELRAEGFDYIIDLHHNLRSSIIKSRLRVMHFSFHKLNLKKWLLVRFGINRLPDIHIVDRYLDAVAPFDVQNDGEGLDYFIPAEDELSREEFPPEFRQPYLVLVPGAMHTTKKMTREQIIRIIRKIELPVILAGGPAEKEEGDAIVTALPGIPVWNAAGRFNINQSASLVRQAGVVITHDTGLMHVAAAFRKKILSVWGNTIPGFGMYPYQPHPDSAMFEVEGLKCRPCSKIGYSSCPKRHFRCMLWQDEDRLADLAKKYMANP